MANEFWLAEEFAEDVVCRIRFDSSSVDFAAAYGC